MEPARERRETAGPLRTWQKVLLALVVLTSLVTFFRFTRKDDDTTLRSVLNTEQRLRNEVGHIERHPAMNGVSLTCNYWPRQYRLICGISQGGQQNVAVSMGSNGWTIVNSSKSILVPNIAYSKGKDSALLQCQESKGSPACVLIVVGPK